MGIFPTPVYLTITGRRPSRIVARPKRTIYRNNPAARIGCKQVRDRRDRPQSVTMTTDPTMYLSQGRR